MVLVMLETQNWLMLFVGAFSLFLIGAIVVVFLKKRHTKLQAEYNENLNQTRLQIVRNRIFIHFICNTLNGLDKLVYDEEFKNRFITLLRKNIEFIDKTKVSLKEELEFTDDYLYLVTQQFGSEFNFHLEVDPELDTNSVFLPPMMIQILVENAVKHGLTGLQGEKHLTIRISSNMIGYLIDIIDNGYGYNPQINNSLGSCVGIVALQDSIRLINNKTRNKIHFEIINGTLEWNRGTHAVLFIPVECMNNL
jgi:LytS/YehU family sensor histidine kinase